MRIPNSELVREVARPLLSFLLNTPPSLRILQSGEIDRCEFKHGFFLGLRL